MAQRVIEAYIEYLRIISPKIISRSGFLNFLPEETRKKYNLYKDISDNKSKVLRSLSALAYDTVQLQARLFLMPKSNCQNS